MESFTASVNVVVPLLLLMCLGMLIRKQGLADEGIFRKIDGISFKIFLPVMLFWNLYNSDMGDLFNARLVIFAAVGVLAVVAVLFAVVPRIIKDNPRRATVIQGIFRTNYIIFGLVVADALYGAEGSAEVTLLGCFMVPLFNALAVAVLEYYRLGKVNIKKILIGIVKNRLIIASILGIIVVACGIKLPYVLEKAVKDVSGITTPLCLISLGGALKFGDFKANLKPVIWCTLARLVFVPLVFMPAAVLAGFRGSELTALMILFASPTAVSSYTMAQQMEADGKLAGQLVASTTLCSVLTIFALTFIFKSFGYI